jgi:hypothetical protein
MTAEQMGNTPSVGKPLLLRGGISVQPMSPMGVYQQPRPYSDGSNRSNVWITLSFSASVTYAASCRAIFNIIMKRERIFRSTRIVHGLVL